MKRRRWVRLKQGNDWGHVYYCMEPLGGMVNTADFARGLKLWSGEPVTIRVGRRVMDATVCLDWRNVEISDMGHVYSTRVANPKFVTGRMHWRSWQPDEVDVDAAWIEGHALNGDKPPATLETDSLAQVLFEARKLPSLAEQGLGWLSTYRPGARR